MIKEIKLKRKDNNRITIFEGHDQMKRQEEAQAAIDLAEEKRKHINAEAGDMITISKGELLKILEIIPDLVWKDTAFASMPEIIYRKIKEKTIEK